MLLSLFCIIVLAGLAAADNIQCIPLNGTSAALMMQSVQDGVVPPPPVQLNLVSGVLQAGTLNQTFIFQLCTSSYVSQTPPDGSSFTYAYG
jgi:hypothetical protein